MRYRVYGKVVAGKYLGEVEADSKEEAREKAIDELAGEMFIGLCHQCARQAEDPEIDVDGLTIEEA